MLDFLKYFKKTPSQEAPSAESQHEQAVIVTFDLTGEFGEEKERDEVYTLEDALVDKLASTQLGDLDGHEFGDGECRMYIYGPDAEVIYKQIEPILNQFSLKPIRVLIRLGVAEDVRAKKIHKRIF